MAWQRNAGHQADGGKLLWEYASRVRPADRERSREKTIRSARLKLSGSLATGARNIHDIMRTADLRNGASPFDGSYRNKVKEARVVARVAPG